MTITIMNRLIGAVVLGLAVAGVNIAADASVRPLAEQMSGTPSLAPLLNQIMSSVVTITITGRSGSEKTSSLDGGHRPRRSGNTRDPAAGRQIKAAGSGVVIDAQQGLIFTNNHVISNAEEITVGFADGRKLLATRVGSDPGTDVAVIKVQAQNLIPLTMGDSDEVEVGDFVLAIGNPYQIGQTVTSGIISGLHRTNLGIEEYEDFIQTDAAIYPGNSGGALVKYGEVRRGRLGITFNEPTPALIRSLKLSASMTSPVIVKVDKGSPAEGAGLRVGDIVSEFARISVRDTSDLHNRMRLLSVGDVADLTVLRSGKPTVIRVTIADQEKNIRSK